jgi:hypothetical protein
MTDQEKIVDLERRLAEQTRRAEIAEAWQKRLTSLLAQPLDQGAGKPESGCAVMPTDRGGAANG